MIPAIDVAGRDLDGLDVLLGHGEFGAVVGEAPHALGAARVGGLEDYRIMGIGDVGRIDSEGYVTISDRMKDIIITSGGKNVSPSEIENSLKTSPFIKEAMVIGDGRKYLTALIAIEYDVVGGWALSKSIPYTTYRDLTEKPEVIELVQGIVNETNEKFATVEQLKAFRLIPKELDHEDGELTATQKIKRRTMEGMYSDLVNGMYRS